MRNLRELQKIVDCPIAYWLTYFVCVLKFAGWSCFKIKTYINLRATYNGSGAPVDGRKTNSRKAVFIKYLPKIYDRTDDV